MAIVIRVKRRCTEIPPEGLVICNRSDTDIALICPSIPIVAKLACTLNNLEDNIVRYLSIGLDKKEVKDRLKRVVCHDILIGACKEAGGNPRYWRYKLANGLCDLNTMGLVEFEKKKLTLLDAEDSYSLNPNLSDLTSIESIDCVYDVYYVEAKNISLESIASIHPVFKHDLRLDTCNEHGGMYSSKSKDGDYQKLFNITSDPEISGSS